MTQPIHRLRHRGDRDRRRASPASRRCAASTSACAAARSMRSSARTAPASRRWSRSSTAFIPPAPMTARSASTERPVAFHLAASGARASGIAYVPQEIEVFEQLTVAENVFAGQTGLGRHPRQPAPAARARRGLFRDFGLALNPAAADRLAHRRAAPSGDDRPRARDEAGGPDARRADRLALRHRGRAALSASSSA